jgi:hypothetical protein
LAGASPIVKSIASSAHKAFTDSASLKNVCRMMISSKGGWLSDMKAISRAEALKTPRVITGLAIQMREKL